MINILKVFTIKSVINSFQFSNMEDKFCSSFPQLLELIFDSLDNRTLVICKKVSRIWNNFLESPKFLLMRKIKKIVETRRKFRKPWKTISRNISTSTIQQLEIATKVHFEYCQLKFKDPLPI